MIHTFIWTGVLVVVIYAYEKQAASLREEIKNRTRRRDKHGKYVKRNP